ncbi:uncharacterized protein LOC124188074 [Neodiprion fabricii]|uniref:uncharacterized protein LOC124188074 n=1 Tax=Neodiprion fabricii TaxID=2872261 RepID=UPI001ED8FCDE|nr:uncharacterized protein LOC124188074 [Neodiprion fabricii]XP_046436376.1 uncharacterized protein LOC124188074 [Neodiprion fabricii]
MCTMVLSKLNEAMIKIGEKPTYELISNEVGTQSIEFKYRVSCRTVRNGKIKSAEGCGLSKKEAKQNAAQTFMQNYLSNLKSEMSDTVQSQFFHSENTSCTVSLRDCILHNVLKILCIEFQMAAPTYTDGSASGPSHAPSFTIKCQVHVFNTKGDGSTKKEAKLRACKKMIAQLMDEKQYFEIFESPQLTESASSREMYCFSRDLKVPYSSKPIGVFGRRKQSSTLSEPLLGNAKLSSKLPILNGSSSTLKTVISNNHQISDCEKSRESCYNLDVNTNLINFENASLQKSVPMKTKCKSFDYLSYCVDNEASSLYVDKFKDLLTYAEGKKAIKRMNETLQSVEKQLYDEIRNTLTDSVSTFKETVKLFSCSYTVSISAKSPFMIFNCKSNSECTDQSIRIGCLAKLLQNRIEYMEKSIHIL